MTSPAPYQHGAATDLDAFHFAVGAPDDSRPTRLAMRSSGERLVTTYNASLPDIPQESVYQQRSPTWFSLGDGSGTIGLEFVPVFAPPIVAP